VVMLNWAVLGIVCREGGYGKAEGWLLMVVVDGDSSCLT
jgi:hypothetical protein